VLKTSTDNNVDYNEFDANDNASVFDTDEHFVDSDNDFGRDDDDLFEVVVVMVSGGAIAASMLNSHREGAWL
jgi:hypothetical protein